MAGDPRDSRPNVIAQPLTMSAFPYSRAKRRVSAKTAGMLLLALLGTVILRTPLMAADTGILRGFVSDSATSEPVPFANVTLKGTRIGGTTNLHGYYVLPAA